MAGTAASYRAGTAAAERGHWAHVQSPACCRENAHTLHELNHSIEGGKYFLFAGKFPGDLGLFVGYTPHAMDRAAALLTSEYSSTELVL